MAWRIGIDIGGTFTDFVATDDNGRVQLWKHETTLGRLEEGVQHGLAGLAEALELELSELLADTGLLVHGTTVATNAVIEGRGPRLGLVCTSGFRDALTFRDGFKWDRFDRHLERPQDLVERSLRVTVNERISRDGDVRLQLDEDSVRQAGATLRTAGAEAVAVALLWAHVNPAHERKVRRLLTEELPGIPVLLSSDVLPEIGEWIRTSATALAAYVYGGVEEYLNGLERWLIANGLPTTPLVMQLNGGCARSDRALRVPVLLIGSGPAAAPAAASALAAALGERDVVAIDMGGTSFDVCVIADGRVPLTRSLEVDHQPIGVAGVEVHSIGAGGGSVAWVDSGGALRVGPESAGARPGPASYDQGGERPTVTDANVVLGYLSPERFLGGRRPLSIERAEHAIQLHVAEPLGIDLVEAAAGILRVVDANMVSAIRVVSIERGLDPRPFLLVAGGGSGPLHAARLASALGIRSVLVPLEAGTLSAYGMTVSDVRLDFTAPFHTTSADDLAPDLRRIVAGLEEDARAALVASGFEHGQIVLARSVDARYLGQVHELTVALPNRPIDERTPLEAADAFGRHHAERYGYSLAARVEFLHWRVTGIGLVTAPAVRNGGPSRRIEAEPAGSRTAYFVETGGFEGVRVYDADRLRPGSWAAGPALVDAATTTIVIPPGHLLSSLGRRGFLLTRFPANDACGTPGPWR